MILARRTFLEFRNLGFGPFSHSTPPYMGLQKWQGERDYGHEWWVHQAGSWGGKEGRD
jgi:hypothetical protein